MVLFLRYAAEPGTPVNAVRQLVAKEVIIAMSQLPSAAAVEPTSEYEDDDAQWVRHFVSNLCADLDFVPIGIELHELVDGFCDQIDYVMDIFEVNTGHHC